MTWTLTPDLEQYILARLESGISLVKICEEENMPSRSTVLRWQRENSEFDAKCARAREAQGDAAADKLDEINEKLEKGSIDPASARVISSNLQWKASKLFSKRYGDSTALKIGGDPDNDTPVKTVSLPPSS